MATTLPTRQPDHTIDNSFPQDPWEVQREGNDEYGDHTASFLKREMYTPEEGPGSGEFVEEDGTDAFEPIDDEGFFDGAEEYGGEDEGFGEGFANDSSFEWEGNVNECFKEPGEEFFSGGEEESFFATHKKHLLIASSVLAVAVVAYMYYKRR